MSARHISPDTPPTRDSAITNQIGIYASACCSFVIALPLKQKDPAQWPGQVVGGLPRFAVAPIEDSPFLQVDSGGSKTVLMPSGERLANVGEYLSRLSFAFLASHTSHLSKTRWDV
ncbi:hypothetical protein [Pseudomonas sp. IT-232MI5]|uniref:hypothetical protein n=1 Tax=Pseudomonas sp. IT-232MI5 TaxID=3026442 RepID=UPI0039DFAEBE